MVSIEQYPAFVVVQSPGNGHTPADGFVVFGNDLFGTVFLFFFTGRGFHFVAVHPKIPEVDLNSEMPAIRDFFEAVQLKMALQRRLGLADVV